jgi:hypothetical protein
MGNRPVARTPKVDEIHLGNFRLSAPGRKNNVLLGQPPTAIHAHKKSISIPPLFASTKQSAYDY